MEVGSEVERFIAEKVVLDGETVSPDDDLLVTDILDSLTIVELVAFLEARFGIRVQDDDLVPENFRTVNEIVAFVQRKGG